VAHLKELTEKLFDISSIQAHPQIKKIFDIRKKSVETGEIDFGTAESFAYATLLEEGYGVRLSGQDVERGTFSHRHAIVHDQETGQTLRPIDVALGPQKKLTVTNSHLSEYGVLGFEYGYNIANPNYLVIWEA
jgi:2-oxoglutarate dehydrogenase E1 component